MNDLELKADTSSLNCLDWFVYRPRGGVLGYNALVCVPLGAYISTLLSAF